MKIGCAGFCEGRKRYFNEFNVVEVQHTFYNPVPTSILKKWREEAPLSFEFTLKALQIITHPPSSPTYRRFKGKKPSKGGFFLPCKEVFEAWDFTFEAAKILEAEKVIFQLPPSFCPSDENFENMDNFFNFIKRDGLKLGIELRCDRWRGKIDLLCKRYDLFHVVDPFSWRAECGEIRYFRLHGKGGYRYKFTEEDFLKLKSLVDRNSYIIFNNIYALEDARRFKDFIL
ncbi:MAG: DUF72 domain-containing protein [Candidatus Aminicenantes bacterium]|nr:DUF72 domain-containing protein [Candidatus Aminicenantes bacterium]